MWTISDTWKAEMARGGVPVRGLVSISRAQFVRLVVSDYTVTNGSGVTIQMDGAVAIEEGVDFDAETSNLITAENIRDALLSGQSADVATSFRFVLTEQADGVVWIDCFDGSVDVPPPVVVVDDPGAGLEVVEVATSGVPLWFSKSDYPMRVGVTLDEPACAVLNGTNAYLSFVDDGGFDSLTAISIEGWAAIGTSSGVLTIAAEDGTSSQYYLNVTRGGGVTFTVSGNPGLNGGTWANAGTLWPDDSDLHHFAISVPVSVAGVAQAASVWVDGSLSSATATLGGVDWTTGTVSAVNFGAIGVDISSPAPVYSPLSCVHRWSVRGTTINGTQAAALYALGMSETSVGIGATPIVELLLDGDATDSSGNGRDFTNNNVTFTDNDVSLTVEAPNTIKEIRGLEMSVDPLMRESSIQDVEIEFVDDGHLRNLLTRYSLVGQSVDIYLGSANIDDSFFENWPRLYVRDFEVRPNREGIILRCADVTATLGDYAGAISATMVPPLVELGNIITTALTNAELEASIDADSFDPATVATQDVGHWLVTRHDSVDGAEFSTDAAQDEPSAAIDFVNGLLFLLGGMLRLSQDGVIEYLHYPLGWAGSFAPQPVRTFTTSANPTGQSAYPCAVESYAPNAENLINAVTVRWGTGLEGGSNPFTNYTERDLTSIGEGGEVREVFATDWLNAAASDGPGQSLHGTTTTLNFYEPSYAGFTGAYTVLTGTTFSQPSWAQLSEASNKIAYALIINVNTANAGIHNADFEVGAFSEPPSVSGTLTAPTSGFLQSLTYEFASGSTYNFLGEAQDFVAGRGGFASDVLDGATPLAFYDLTIQHAVASRILARYRFGAPRVVIRTGLEHFDLEIGDLVSLLDDDFVGFGLDGLAASEVFEVNRKTVRAFEDDPCIEFELTMLYSTRSPFSDPLRPSWNVMDAGLVS